MDDISEEFSPTSKRCTEGCCQGIKTCTTGILKNCELACCDARRWALLRVILQITVDAAAVGVALFLNAFINVLFDPVEREILCEDFTIKYPFVGKIGRYDYVFMCFGFILLPSLLIPVIDLLYYFSIGPYYSARTCMIKVYNTEVVFLFGMFASQALIGILQLCSGRMRPNFLEICKPDMAKHCSSKIRPLYAFQPACRGMKDEVKMARLSFPSEYSAMSIQSMVFLCFHIEQKLIYRESIMFKRLIQLVLLQIAIWMSFYQVREYRNHRSDVFVGMIFGAILGWLMDYFNRKTSAVKVIAEDI